MNAFFASIEQLDNPEYRGKPIGVTNGKTGTCIITCSYEARALGIHTTMRLKQARALCPGFIRVPARPERYAEVSTGIMHALLDITPDVEVFSVDEAFLDITRCQAYWNKSPEAMGKMIKALVWDVSGLPCSVGLSGDKTTAKFAGKQQKPDGLTIIPPWEARDRLKDVPVIELCGVNKGIAGFLARRGAFTCGDVARLPDQRTRQALRQPRPAHLADVPGGGPRAGRDKDRPAQEPGARQGDAAEHDGPGCDLHVPHPHGRETGVPPAATFALAAQKYFIGLRTRDGWVGSNKLRTTFPTNDSRPIIELCHRVVHEYWRGEGVFQVQVTALDPRPEKGQTELFGDEEDRFHRLNRVMDDINNRYGEFTLTRAKLMHRSEMPNVIAPAWKPYGHRQTIVPTTEKKRRSANRLNKRFPLVAGAVHPAADGIRLHLHCTGPEQVLSAGPPARRRSRPAR